MREPLYLDVLALMMEPYQLYKSKKSTEASEYEHCTPRNASGKTRLLGGK